MHARTILFPFAALLASCGPTLDVRSSTSTSLHAIRGGTRDDNTRNVVGVVRVQPHTIDICTGSLIAANVVVTARHCVSDLASAPNGTVSCANSAFLSPDVPDNFLVTNSTDLPTDENSFARVVDVNVQSPDGHVCGDDVAVLVLAAPLAIPALTPLVDDNINAGESYDAVGYGASDTGGTGAGTRRRVDGLVVDCFGAACNDAAVDDAEWVGGGGPCQGDSGGPALDVVGRVAGLVSRADMSCEHTVYEALSPHAPFLREAATSAADRAGIAPPVWVHASTASGASSSGCAAATDAPSTLVFTALVAFALRRTRPRIRSW
jgi:hypothetical protein